MKNTLLLKALACKNDSSRPPVWMMRQAGRHLATYRAIRSRFSFLEMCHDPDLIAEITLLPLQAYDLDAAILFSDILIVPEAMGLTLRFEDHVGPVFENPLVCREDTRALRPPDPAAFEFVSKGIKNIKALTDVPLVGFCGAPFTVASYMIEGRSSKDLKKTKTRMFHDPEGFHELLEKITDRSIEYLKLQIESGVDAVQIFDSWANFLGYPQFREFSLHYFERILNELHSYDTPVILFCMGSSVFAPELAGLKPACIGLDKNCSPADIRKRIPRTVALQGNLDPDILHAPLPLIEREVDRLLDEMAGDPGYIFNLGHGIAPDVSEEAVRTLVSCVKRRASCPAASLS